MPKRRNRNKNRNQQVSNGHEAKKTKKKNQNGNVKKTDNLSSSSPRPTNLTNNYLNFDNKRNSGSELDEFHTPNNEYPEFSNDLVEKSLNKTYDDEWDDLGSFKKPNLEGIPEMDHLNNFSSRNYRKLNCHASDGDVNATLVTVDDKKVTEDPMENVTCNGRIPLENDCQQIDKQNTVELNGECVDNEKENDESEEFFECQDSKVKNLPCEQNHASPSCNGDLEDECEDFTTPVNEEHFDYKDDGEHGAINENINEPKEDYVEYQQIIINNDDDKVLNSTSASQRSYYYQPSSSVDIIDNTTEEDDCPSTENENYGDPDRVDHQKGSEDLSPADTECQHEYLEKTEHLFNSNESVNNVELVLNTSTTSSEEISVRTILTELINNRFSDHINDDDENIERKTYPDEMEYPSTEDSVADHNGLNGNVDDIYCTDEKLEEELLPVPELKIEISHKIVIKRSMTLFVRTAEESHSITNVTSISDENLNLSYNDDEQPISKHGKKSYNFVKNIFSKFKKRKNMAKNKKENKKTLPKQTSLPENNEYLDDSSIPYNNSGREVEVDSNKALKSYGESICNFEDGKQREKGSCNKSENDFEIDSSNGNLDKTLVAKNSANVNIDNNSISDDVFQQDVTEQVSIVYSQENIVINLELKPSESLTDGNNTGKIDVEDFYRDIDSLNKSFLFLNDTDNVSVKENIEQIEQKDTDQCTITTEDPKKGSLPSSQVDGQQDCCNKFNTEPGKRVKSEKSSLVKHKRKFFTLFSRKQSKPVPFDDVQRSPHIESIDRSEDETHKYSKDRQLKVDDDELEKFDEVLKSLRSSIFEEDKVISKNDNNLPLKIVEECPANKTITVINDDHLFPDAITPSKIVNISSNDSYDFVFIDDPVIVEMDSLTLFKGETKKVLVPIEYSAPFASLETLCFSEKSEHSELLEKSTPVHNIKKSFNYLKNFLTVNR